MDVGRSICCTDVKYVYNAKFITMTSQHICNCKEKIIATCNRWEESS